MVGVKVIELPLGHILGNGDGVNVTVIGLLLVKTTELELGGHVPLEIVHTSVALVPFGTPVTVVVARFDEVMVAVPLVTVQIPVPTEGVLPAKVKLPLAHLICAEPAREVDGGA